MTFRLLDHADVPAAAGAYDVAWRESRCGFGGDGYALAVASYDFDRSLGDQASGLTVAGSQSGLRKEPIDGEIGHVCDAELGHIIR